MVAVEAKTNCTEARGCTVAGAAPATPPNARRRETKMHKHTYYETNHCCRWSGFDAGAAKPTAGSTDADRPICEIWLSV